MNKIVRICRANTVPNTNNIRSVVANVVAIIARTTVVQAIIDTTLVG